eukprot:1147859-Pelagomonas_calceolata.AAC.2
MHCRTCTTANVQLRRLKPSEDLVAGCASPVMTKLHGQKPSTAPVAQGCASRGACIKQGSCCWMRVSNGTWFMWHMPSRVRVPVCRLHKGTCLCTCTQSVHACVQSCACARPAWRAAYRHGCTALVYWYWWGAYASDRLQAPNLRSSGWPMS